jgi:hypothetical protein
MKRKRFSIEQIAAIVLEGNSFGEKLSYIH